MDYDVAIFILYPHIKLLALRLIWESQADIGYDTKIAI